MRVYISDSTAGGSHGDNVLASFLSEYNIPDDVTLNKDHASYSIQNVKDDMLIAYNAGYELFISSAYGGYNFRAEAISYYPSMLCCFPNGTNTHEEFPRGVNYTIPEIMVVCGGGDTNNENGYPIEFFDNDPITTETTPIDEADASSFSTPVIAAKLLKIKDGRNCEWIETVQSARATASLSSLDNENGYGIIDVNSAIAYTGLTGLFIGDLTAVRGIGKASTITLERIIDATDYKIEVRKLRSNYQEIIETTDLGNAYTLPSYGHFKFRYMGYNGSLESAWSSWQEIKYNSFNVIVS